MGTSYYQTITSIYIPQLFFSLHLAGIDGTVYIHIGSTEQVKLQDYLFIYLLIGKIMHNKGNGLGSGTSYN